MALSTTTLITWGWIGGDGTQPDPPSNLTVTQISTTVLLVDWDFDAYATGFDLYRSLTVSGTYVKTNSLPILDLSFYDGQTTHLSADTIYFYKLKALGANSGTDSEFSEAVSGRK